MAIINLRGHFNYIHNKDGKTIVTSICICGGCFTDEFEISPGDTVVVDGDVISIGILPDTVLPSMRIVSDRIHTRSGFSSTGMIEMLSHSEWVRLGFRGRFNIESAALDKKHK